MAAPIQRVTVPSWEWRGGSGTTRAYVAYTLKVELPVQSWTVNRRYSDFVALHAAITPPPTPVPLPPKHAATHTLRAIAGIGGLLPASDARKKADAQHASERQLALEQYLRAIVCADDAHWREHPAFIDFLNLPKKPRTQSTKEIATRRGSATDAARTLHRPFASSSAARGSPVGRDAPAQETDATRAESSAGLLEQQRRTMDTQDAQVDQLTAILRRQRHIGLAINDELAEQQELLTDLHSSVHDTQQRIEGAEKQVKRLD